MRDYSNRLEHETRDLKTRLRDEEKRGAEALNTVNRLNIELRKMSRKASEVDELRSSTRKLTERLENVKRSRRDLENRLEAIERRNERRRSGRFEFDKGIRFVGDDDFSEEDEDTSWFVS